MKTRIPIRFRVRFKPRARIQAKARARRKTRLAEHSCLPLVLWLRWRRLLWEHCPLGSLLVRSSRVPPRLWAR